LHPALDWAIRNLGTQFYLLGSDYVFPITANTIAKAFLAIRGGVVVAERYVPLITDANTINAIVEHIALVLPTGTLIE
jgi:urea transport system substrate-binding protein